MYADIKNILGVYAIAQFQVQKVDLRDKLRLFSWLGESSYWTIKTRTQPKLDSHHRYDTMELQRRPALEITVEVERCASTSLQGMRHRIKTRDCAPSELQLGSLAQMMLW